MRVTSDGSGAARWPSRQSETASVTCIRVVVMGALAVLLAPTGPSAGYRESAGPRPAASTWSSRLPERGQSDGWQIPQDAATEISPLPETADRIARGRDLYEDKCRRCHGPSGAGKGPDADPDDPPGDLTDGSRASRNPDGVMFYKIWNGRNDPEMPAFKTDLTREDVWTVIQYVKTLRR